MSEILINLAENQYLSDTNIHIQPHCRTLLEAGTGTGKTHFIMQHLKQQFLDRIIVMLVPTQAKTLELEHKYFDKHGYCFFHGEKKPEQCNVPSHGIIVCTYDKFADLHKLLPDDYVLVIDEVHKLISAGSYRDTALNPILAAMQKNTPPTQLLLTATYSPYFFPLVGIEFEHHLKVEKQNMPLKQFNILQYLDGDELSFVKTIEDLLMTNRQRYTNEGLNKKLMIARINDRKHAKICQAYFEETYQAKCLFVSGQNKHHENVQDIFEQERIPNDIDILFTTSILDEAVNLLNKQHEVDSVHIIGKRIHPEDIVQFMGRLRHANVPCYMHCHTEIGYAEHVDIPAIHQQGQDRILQYYAKVTHMATLLAALITDNIFVVEDDASNGIHDKVRKLNTTFEDIMGCKMFWVDDNQPKVNYASILATLHRMDTAYCYSEFEYLAARLQELYPHLEVSAEGIENAATPERITAFFDQAALTHEQAFQQGVDEVLTLFCRQDKAALHHAKAIKKPKKSKKLSEPVPSLKLIAQYFRHKVKSSDDYAQFWNGNVIRNVDYQQFESIFAQVVALAEHIGNLHEIREIILNNQVDEVIKLAIDYKENLFVRYLSKHFDQYFYAGNVDPDINQQLAIDLIIDSYRNAKQQHHIPMGKIIRDGFIKGATLKNGQVYIEASKALNFIKKHFAVQDKNRNKPQKRYLIFQNVNKYGYQYLANAHLGNVYCNPVPDHVELLGVRYHNLTGTEIPTPVDIDLSDL